MKMFPGRSLEEIDTFDWTRIALAKEAEHLMQVWNRDEETQLNKTPIHKKNIENQHKKDQEDKDRNIVAELKVLASKWQLTNELD